MAATWRETYEGGSPEAERLIFERLARDILDVQVKNRAAAKARAVKRAFHAKAVAAAADAELTFLNEMPTELVTGFAQPGKSYAVAVRFSNAAGSERPDWEPDLRGVALRIEAGPGEHHDMLMTNFPVSHARNARQFVAFAVATAGGRASRVIGLARLAATIGPAETVRMVRNIAAGRRRKVRSLALETYWSRGAIRWGEHLAVRYLLRPAPGARPAPEPSRYDADCLVREFAGRLAEGDIQFELCVQPFVDAQSTPIEDTAIAWSEIESPPIPVATLRIPQRAPGVFDARALDHIVFNPWNTTDEFRPLGNLNRARKSAYDASGAHRLEYRWLTRPPLRNVILGAGARRVFQGLNRVVEWHRLPVRTSLLNLDAFRHVLRERNLLDTEIREAPPAARPLPVPPDERMRVTRDFEGRFNDLSEPSMGAVGATFGRNMAPDHRPELFNEPNPIIVSQQLLHRRQFIPARSLNLLAAAWIQFQVHDWVTHARHPLGKKDVVIPLPEGMGPWVNKAGGNAENEMRIAGNKEFREGAPDILFANAASHWWDGSEVYGANEKDASRLREGAKLRLDEHGHLPQDMSGMEVTGFNESWWLGLSALHTLFAREHNLICDELRLRYKTWDDDRIYHTARLIVSALIAKIHTVEWTPAILATKAIEIGLSSNWNGPPASDWLTRMGIWLLDVHAATGIPKTFPDHHAAPYSLTEDFATVYRMHPLIPDDYRLFDHRNGAAIADKTFLDLQGALADDLMRSVGLRNSLYSFGIAHPGAITLHNNPRTLENFERDGERINLSVVDLVRTRRRGVPRYNDFRAGLHKPRITRWEDLTANPEDVRLLKDIYREIDLVDTVVGLFAETPPAGFGFSDTAFRIFILMASRRLQSDRFLTVDFRPEIYSPLGMDWVANNTMTSVILRHCPELAGLVPRTASAFSPWRAIVPPAGGKDGH